jgi:hypothetical protein
VNPFTAKLSKRSWRLLPWSALHPVVEAMMVGAAKYGDRTWEHKPYAIYEDALLRHVTAHISGDCYDHADTGLPHLALAAANALIIVAKMQREIYGPTYEADVARCAVHPQVRKVIEALHAAEEGASGGAP